MRGWAGPVTKTSVFATAFFSNQDALLPQHTMPKWHNFGLECISTLGVCKLALLVKLQESTKL